MSWVMICMSKWLQFENEPLLTIFPRKPYMYILNKTQPLISINMLTNDIFQMIRLTSDRPLGSSSTYTAEIIISVKKISNKHFLLHKRLQVVIIHKGFGSQKSTATTT